MNNWPNVIVLIGLLILCACGFLLWRMRSVGRTQGKNIRGRVQEAIRQWLEVPSRSELAELERRIHDDYEAITGRLEGLQSTLAPQNRLEDLTADMRRRLARLETVHQERMTEQSPRRVGSGSLLRLGVRLTFTDRLWEILGIAIPNQLTDEQIDKVLQGPFCRNCLRSLVARSPQAGSRRLQTTCQHCSWVWQDHSDSPSLPLVEFKRHVYDRLDAEYRQKGYIGVPEEVKTDEPS